MTTRNLDDFLNKSVPSIVFTGGKYPENFSRSILFNTVYKKVSDIFIGLSSSCEKLHNLMNICEKFHKLNPLSQLIQHNFFTISADSGLKTAEKMNFFSNYIIGDFDSLKNSHKILKKYPKECIKSFSTYKNFTDTEIAIKTVFNEFANAFVILVGGDGGRIDHLLSNFKIFESDNCPNIWFTKNSAIFFLSSDKINSLVVNKLIFSDYISIFPLIPTNNLNFSEYKIFSQGLEWNLDKLNWAKGQYSVSNRVKSDENRITLQCKYGRFLVFLPYTCSIE
ncbi:MAG: thiamine diphosphokinase [Treponema sp.]|nr:thiamine diphosphokinase [Treponema sp.]